MSSYISPVCIRPIFMINDIKDAEKCGMFTGLFYAIILCIIISLTAIKYFIKNSDRKLIYILIGIILFIFIMFPLYYKYGHRNEWIGYNEAKKELVEQGYSKIEIFNILNSFSKPIAIPSTLTTGLLTSKKKSPDDSNYKI